MSTASTASSGTKRKRGSEMKFYAVRAGQIPGIYHSWADCKEQITGFKGAVYKSFVSLTEAQAFLKGDESTSAASSAPKKFYAVANGREPGVYTDWPSAQKQITGWTKPKHKSFSTRAEAEAFVAEGPGSRDVTGFFPPDSPPPIKVHDGALADSPEATPAPKKSKATAKSKPAPQPLSGPGFDPMGIDAEDGFDNRILMDREDGEMRYKTETESTATKLMPNTDHHGEVLDIWTDGACMFNGQAGASIGGVGVYFGPRDPRNLAEPLLGKQTNNRAELTALKRALSIAPMNRKVRIFTDSKYSIDCVTKWHEQWAKKNWKTAQGKDVENKDIIQDILKLLDDRARCRGRTDFLWVKGHAGLPENEEADRLAVAGALENKEKGINHPLTLSDENGKGLVYSEGGTRLLDFVTVNTVHPDTR